MSAAVQIAAVAEDPLTSPIPQEKGDVAALLLERLDAWKHACGYLEEYVEATANLHKSLSKDYDKVLKTVNEPLREGHHFSQANGGVASFFENIRANTQALANTQLETEKALRGQLLPTLNRLHSEIKNKHKELTSGAAKGAKAVERARGLTQKQLEHLGTNTANFDSVGGKIEPTQDPYIIQRAVQHHLHKQVLEENAHKKDLLDVQNNFLVFEKHVLETLRGAFSQFFQIAGGQTDKNKQFYADINANFQNIPDEFEWTNFTVRSAEVLIDPTTPNRSLDAIKFPNQDHRSSQPLINGLLSRKGKIMKSYDSYHYAVTPAGYLHEFSKNNDFKEHPEPELSLYLSECVIGAPPAAGEAKFIVAGKDANKNQHLTGKHEFSFKAGGHDEAMKWYSIIEQFTTGKLTRQNSIASTKSPVSDPTSPVIVGETIPEEKPAVAKAAVEEKPAAPPIDTKAAAKPEASGSTSAPASAKVKSPTTGTAEKGEKSHKKFGLFGRG
ncbi:hypothetical protein TWF569_004993 [Orbilia oligospora]|uniref:PH domain-containing protein n=1 Tax=Orbilia oligospora TaxID=2813651 RepID=A0A7C8PCD1_ORBOL|nr:hypothetical protein TWF703_003948 [Orbilia oligospora]KAF3149822.1 hypothetical protein TWF569_004993 [Orbilia oligospora]